MERKRNFTKKLLLILMALALLLQTPAGVLAAEAGKEDTQTQEAGITDAAKKKGWVETADGTYYFYKKGKMATGWRTIDGKKYYFRKSGGKMVTGWKTLSGKTYYFNKKGVLQTGWKTIDEKKYYFEKDGKMVTGWKTLKGKKYYFSKKGVMQTGWKKIQKKWYRFNLKTGAAMTGLKTLGAARFYFDAGGVLSTGWKTIGGARYYFYEKETKKHSLGEMAKDTTIDGKKIGKDGKMIVTTPPMSEAEKAMISKAQGYSSPTGYLVLANTSTHRVGVYKGSYGKWQKVKYYTVATGAPNMPTREGVFYRGIKLLYFNSGSDRCWYATQYSGNYLFHSVLYTQNSSPTTITDGRLDCGVSHGCIRMRLEEAKWIYDNIPANTKIVVYH
jgi:lipoprotein-anchoring transpeptidase ErfK/SrfK